MTKHLPDPRRNAYREDLAAKELEGVVDAGGFSEGELQQIVAQSTGFRATPDKQAPLVTEGLFGETVKIFEQNSEWSWGQLQRDGYVGYLATEDLTHELTSSTHFVSAPCTFVFSQPDIKSQPALMLSLNSNVQVTDEDGNFLRIGKIGFIYKRHLSASGERASDYVSIAEKFCGTPYLWGGCQRMGIDCSGLVQMSMMSAGIRTPRDSDMQEEELGEIIEGSGARKILKRGDLVFWSGHVGIMCNGQDMVHASAFHMSTEIEPLDLAIVRIRQSGKQVSSFRRLSLYG